MDTQSYFVLVSLGKTRKTRLKIAAKMRLSFIIGICIVFEGRGWQTISKKSLIFKQTFLKLILEHTSN